MSKLDQLRALGDAKRVRTSTLAKADDGVALTSMTHPPGLIEKIAGAIRSGKLKVSPPNPVAKATKGKAGTAEVKGLVRRSTTGTGLRVGAAVAVQPATSEIMDVTGRRDAHQLKRGRPLAKNADKALMQTKPWLAEGMSRASWYRRKREAEKTK